MSDIITINTHPFSFSLQTNCSLVKHNLALIYKDKINTKVTTNKPCDYALNLTKSSGLRRFIKPQARFLCDQREPFKPLKLEQAYAFLEWGMNYTIAANEMQHVIIHSAVLAKGDKAILFPAPPGSGKSTLTAYLAFNGWRLLSDEMALIIPQTNQVMPFVRPICLKNNSIELAKKWFPKGDFSTIAKDTHKGDVIHLSPPESSWLAAQQPANIVGIVFPNYTKEKILDIFSLNKNQGFMQLANNAFNYGVIGETGFNTLTAIVESVNLFEIFYNDLNEVTQFLEQDIIAHA